MLIGQKASVWPWRTGTAQTSLGLITASTTLTIETGANTRTMWLTGQHPPLLQLWTEPPQPDTGMGLRLSSDVSFTREAPRSWLTCCTWDLEARAVSRMLDLGVP